MPNLRTLPFRIDLARRTLGRRLLKEGPLHALRPRFVVMLRPLDAPISEYEIPEPWRHGHLQESDLAALRGLDPRMDEFEVRTRIDHGQRCSVFWHGDTLAYYRWEATRSLVDPYLGRTVRLLEGDILVGTIFTRPEFRRQGVWRWARSISYMRARDEGFKRNLGLVAAWNRPAWAHADDNPSRHAVGAAIIS